MPFPKPYADFVQRFRVPGGFVLLAVFVWLSQPTWRSIGIGMPVCLAGMLIRAWAAGHLAKNEQLAQSGPYGYVRNPLYVGSLLAAAGVVIASRHAGLAAVFAAAILLVYLPVIQLEEEHLRRLFPEFGEYARRVPSLWPRLKPAGAARPFRWPLYRRNQEWKAVSGLLFAVALLVWKAGTRR
ncbi:MAG: isoprenylcysteine carboxylmethyltransferase family protein [Acidobacteria bacterium]|nr:isoprenylcysteine carboxylmethyltransferase family protein [Acidobacteriota bacterium]